MGCPINSTEGTMCPFHAPGVLCSPQVYGKLINPVPLMCGAQMAQRVNGVLVYIQSYIRVSCRHRAVNGTLVNNNIQALDYVECVTF